MAQNDTGRTWDHEDCPRDDCDGELQQQDRFNVMCLSCERVWSHVKSETKHYLQTVDFETVAEKPVAMSDGGADLTCRKCGERFQKPVNLSMHYRVVHTGALQLGLADQSDRSVDTDTDRGVTDD